MPKSPAVQLKEWIASQLTILNPGERFPTDRHLSSAWGVSERTVYRIFKGFEEQGEVLRVRGSGTFVAGADIGTGTNPALPANSVESIVEAVRKAIGSGEFKRREALPSVKFMCLKFRVSAPTVIKAYRVLRARGFVERIGKTFWIGTLGEIAKSGPQKEVLFLQHENDDFSVPFQKDNMLSLSFQKMERELYSHGFRLKFGTTSLVNSQLNRWLSTEAIPYGIVLYAMDSGRLALCAASLKKLLKNSGERRPSVLVDWAFGDHRDVPGGCTILSRGNLHTVVARTLAREITHRGYRAATLFYDETETGYWNFWSLWKIRTELKAVRRDFSLMHVIKPCHGERDTKAFLARHLSGQLQS
ncbi:MAG: GntR family transcriptional regulator, partial [Chitinivibrionales bacterium]|nr:GntR family transcriptional regulator [Chitinivibrionales bacterium]MBD3395014.1 GntR family transcriptional regulator [Chitinivibrionales bacterium]